MWCTDQDPCARSPPLRCLSLKAQSFVRRIQVSAAHGDSESTAVSVSREVSEAWMTELNEKFFLCLRPLRPVPTERTAAEDCQEAVSVEQEPAEQPAEQVDGEVQLVIAAMSASNGDAWPPLAEDPEAFLYMSRAMASLCQVPAESSERGRCSSRSTEDEPECEGCAAVSSRAPSPDAVPSPGLEKPFCWRVLQGILLPGRPSLAGAALYMTSKRC